MQFKITYVKAGQIRRVVLEAKTLNEVMRRGFKETQWDGVLEVSTADDQSLQGVV